MTDEPRYPYLHVEVSSEEVEEVSYLLWELGAQGVEERDQSTLNRASGLNGVTLVASFAEEAGARAAAAELYPREASVTFVIGDAWRDAYKAYFKVTRLGERLVIRPSWEPFTPGVGDVVVTVDPGRAFGTGTHESTRLVMKQLDQRVSGGERVLDVGCGTGILAICALKLGAASALCIDVDADAVAVTLENAELNRVRERLVSATTAVEQVEEAFPVVLANIQTTVLVPLRESLAARVQPGGLLVLSGILIGQEQEVLGAYPAFETLAAPTEGEWVALALRKKA